MQCIGDKENATVFTTHCTLHTINTIVCKAVFKVLTINARVFNDDSMVPNLLFELDTINNTLDTFNTIVNTMLRVLHTINAKVYTMRFALLRVWW